jgi:hypothetical protein
LLGFFGVLLPIVDALSAILFGGISFLPSISSTHYFNSYLLFEGLVFCTGLFLICYHGYDVRDKWLTTVAGIGAVILTLSPCKYEPSTYSDAHNWLMLPMSVTNVLHLVGAVVFFVLLFVIIEFQFPQTSRSSYVRPGTTKSTRNILYRILGVVMLLGMVYAFLPGDWGNIGYFGRTYIGEAIALWSFGVAWLVKGKLFLRDDNEDNLKVWTT